MSSTTATRLLNGKLCPHDGAHTAFVLHIAAWCRNGRHQLAALCLPMKSSILSMMPHASLAGNGFSLDVSRLVTADSSWSGAAHTTACIAAKWSPSSAWWLSISSGLGTTMSGLPACSVSKMLPEPGTEPQQQQVQHRALIVAC
eukprot:GHRQ01026273.1.p1 GENE.GHRQ01026273.1~~GHRQ01026273.1.p1  ORF type:complete len:144 (-),score=27.92 GHRQ01026273.1:248-679(-)